MNLPKAAFAFFLFFLVLICVPPASGQTVNCYVTPRPPGCVSALTVLTRQAINLYALMEAVEARVKMLQAQLEKCGNCAERAKIQADLNQALEEQRQKRAVEEQAFAAYGFGELGVRNFDDLREYIRRGLQTSSADAETNRRLYFVKNAISLHCLTLYEAQFRIYALSDAERKEVVGNPKAHEEFARKWGAVQSQCQQEADPRRLAAYQEIISKSCFVKHDFWGGHWEEKEAFYTCMNENDPVTAVCTQDALMQWEIRQRKILHREPPPNPCYPYIPDENTLRAYHNFGTKAGTATPPPPSSPGKPNAARPSASSPAPPSPSPTAAPAASPQSASVQPAPEQVSVPQITASGSVFMPGSDPYTLSPRQLSILSRPATGPVVHAGARVVVRTIEPIDLTNTDAKRRFRAQTEVPIEFGLKIYAPKGADVFLKAVGNPLPGGNLWAPHITVDYVIVNGQRMFVPTQEPIPGPGLLTLKDGKVVPSARNSGAAGILAPQTLLSFMVTDAIPEGEIEAAERP